MKEVRNFESSISLFESLEQGRVLEWEDIVGAAVVEGVDLGFNPDVKGITPLIAERRVCFGKGIYLEKLIESIKESKDSGQLKWDRGKKKRPRGMLVATESSLRRFGIEAGLKELRPLFKEATLTHFTGFSSEPSSGDVAEATIKAYLADVNFLVAIGGGSSLDLAKATNVCLCDSRIKESLSKLDKSSTKEEKNEVRDSIIKRLSVYLSGEISDEFSWDKIRADLPLIAIPTTAGTGSEVTSFAVINDSGTPDERKSFLLVSEVRPDVVILDPTLTLSLPENYTAWTGLDAIVHALEAFIGRRPDKEGIPGSTNETLSLAGWALKLAGESIAEVKRNGRNLPARAKMQLASFLAGLAFGNSHLGPVHDLGEPFGHEYHLVHGDSLGRILPPVLNRHIFIAQDEERFGRVNLIYQDDVRATVDRIKQGIELLLNVETTDAKDAVRKLEGFLKRLGVKTSLVDFGLGKSEIEEIIEKVQFPGMSDESHPNLYDVPYWEREDYLQVMKEATGLV